MLKVTEVMELPVRKVLWGKELSGFFKGIVGGDGGYGAHHCAFSIRCVDRGGNGTQQLALGQLGLGQFEY